MSGFISSLINFNILSKVYFGASHLYSPHFLANLEESG
jgi:hypothetical protein